MESRFITRRGGRVGVDTQVLLLGRPLSFARSRSHGRVSMRLTVRDRHLWGISDFVGAHDCAKAASCDGGQG